MAVAGMRTGWSGLGRALRGLCAAALLAGSAGALQAYPFPDIDLGALDVDKTHGAALGPHGEFLNIPAKEADACWLCGVASVVSRLAGDNAAAAQQLYQDWVGDQAGNIPLKSGQQIADFINLKPETYNARAAWYSTLALTEQGAQNRLEVLVNQALEGDAILLANLRRFGQAPALTGHVTVLDGWRGLTDPDSAGLLLGIVDSNADWRDDRNQPADSTLLTLTFEEQEITPTGGAKVKRWMPVLTYWPQNEAAPVFTDYLTGFVAVTRIAEPDSAALVVLSLLALAAARRRA